MQRAPLPSVPEGSPAPPASSTPTPSKAPPAELAQACERTDASLAELTTESRAAEGKLRKRAHSSGRFQPFKGSRSSG